MRFKEIFKTNRNVVIAMLHVPALPGNSILDSIDFF